MTNVPYTYLIKFIPTGQYYYGCRFTDSCNPDELWVTYFTSSIDVASLIEGHGADSFAWEIRKTFTSRESALRWETRFLQKVDAVNSSRWLNKTNGGGNTNTHHSADSRHRMVLSNRSKDPVIREKISTTAKLQYANGSRISHFKTNNPSFVEESIAKRQNTYHQNKHQQGLSNSQFGTMWITNGDVNMKCKVTDNIPDGFRRGRVIKKI